MQIWLSSEVDGTVADDLRPIRNLVENVIQSRMMHHDYGGNVTKWAHISMIFGEFGPPEYKEIKRFHKKTGVCEFRLKIDYDAFKQGAPARRAGLLIESLLRSLDLMETMKSVQCDIPALRRDVQEVAAERGWLPSSSSND
jgi:hypothetical protein